MKTKTLVCVIGELRATELTFESFKEKLLIPNNADLLLCIPDDKKDMYKNNPYYKIAKYIKVFDNSQKITEHYEKICEELNGNSDWKKLMYIKNLWLGGIKDLSQNILISELKRIIKHKEKRNSSKIIEILIILFNRILRKKGPLDQLTGSGYVLLYKHLLFEMIKEKKLNEEYDRFVITRSDHIYGAFHPPVKLLNPEYVWIPEGEDWRGYCDRHWVLSREHLDKCLNLLEPIFYKTDELFELMQKKFDWNSESYIKLIFDMNNIKVKRFPRTQFIVRGSYNTKTWTKGVYNKKLQLKIAYPSEYELAEKNLENFSKITDWNKY